MPIPIWAGRYIGLPFLALGRDRGGLDCWGLVRLVLHEQFGRVLPSFSTEYRHTTDKDRIGALITREARFWQAVPASQEQAGDVIVLRMQGMPMHVGLVLGDRHMLHIERGIESVIEKYASRRWQDRICGFYRHVSSNKGHTTDDNAAEEYDDGYEDFFGL